MGDRQTTNILLAIIAGVLLFGSSATLGALKWLCLALVGLIALYVVYSIARYLAREAYSSLREAKESGWRTLAMTLAGFVMIPFIIALVGQALLLWLDGVINPMKSALDTKIGTAWMIVGGAFLASVACVCASDFIKWVYVRRTYIPAFCMFVVGLVLRAPLAVIFLPQYGWRKANNAGDGLASCIATAAVGVFFGVFISFLSAVLIFTALQKLVS